MKPTIFILFLLLITGVMLLTGCAETRTVNPQPITQSRFVDVYFVDGSCFPTTLAKGGIIENLWMFPGDSVAFVNTRKSEIHLKFPDGMFEVIEAKIPSGKRVILKVIETNSKSGAITLVNEDCVQGAPKFQVGEEP